MNMPSSSVTAKPLIGPLPNWNKKTPEIVVATIESQIAVSARS